VKHLSGHSQCEDTIMGCSLNLTADKNRQTPQLTEIRRQKGARMWANAQRDGRHAEYKWRRLFNAADAQY